MTCDELKDDYATYALGSLDGETLAELREHLSRQCENCTPGVRQARETVARLALAVTPVNPPKRLRRRVIALVNPNAVSRWNIALVLVTAVSIIFAVHIWLRHQESHREFNAFLAKFNDMQAKLAVLEDPLAKEVTFGKGARGRVVVSPQHGVAFSGQNLAALPSGKTYEMWIIPKGGKPVPAGTFAPSADGSALHLQTGPVDLASIGAVAVSVEPAGGVASPTAGQIIIVAPL
jgi:anti-sigma-K factor RskA